MSGVYVGYAYAHSTTLIISKRRTFELSNIIPINEIITIEHNCKQHGGVVWENLSLKGDMNN